ncbi:MAG TPA: DNA topoisomerase IB [Terriglobia bacterium]|nr:DNA topoisomerase IB [Terriglobia bacterium]
MTKLRHVTITSEPFADPSTSADLAGLHYVSGLSPGITRRRAGRGFAYIDSNGNSIRDHRVLARIRSLVIPPAWTEVWICPSAKGHLQAVGRDTRGRKQYLYHPDYRRIRDETKYHRMIAFGKALPGIRSRVAHDLKRRGLPKAKVLAAVVRLLEDTRIRVGNEEYAKTNHSFGLTTMRARHLHIDSKTLRFQFRGKSGQEHQIEIEDHQIARIVKLCHDLPGYELFQYVNGNGEPASIVSEDVNQYLREITQQDFTAKDFRTWTGSALAVLALEEIGAAETKTVVKKNIAAAIKSVSQKLGNRPPACRKYYVHPAVLEAYEEGNLLQALARARSGDRDTLYPEELALMNLLASWEKKRSIQA